jgi:hypothetical protein
VISTKWTTLKKQAEDATKALPDDWYDVTVVKADAVKAQSSGADMIKMTFKVTSGPHENRLLWTNFVLTPDSQFAMGLWFARLGAFGLDDAFFKGLETADASLESDLNTIATTLVGRFARVQTNIRQWNGQDRNEIVSYVEPQGGPLGGTNGPATPMTGIPTSGNVSSAAPNSPPVVPSGPPAVPSTTSAPPAVSSGDAPSAPPELKF